MGVLAPFVALVGCAPAEPPPGWLERLAASEPPPPGTHWPVPPSEAHSKILQPLELIQMERPGSGTTDVFRAVVWIDGERFTVKWKPVPGGDGEAFNNSPRRELAAWEVQRWFLEPADYVVPPVTLHCLPVEALRPFDRDAEPQLDRLRDDGCVLGAVSLWLDDLEVADDIYSPERFYADPAYAWHMANFDLFTYLVRFGDGAPANVPTSTDPENRRVFAIDNGMSFSGLRNPFAPDWSGLRVPALPAESVARLREVSDDDLEALGQLAVVVRDDGGVRQRAGEGGGEPVLALGLTQAERRAIRERIARLEEMISREGIALF